MDNKMIEVDNACLPIEISGSHNTIHLRQVMELDSFALDTFGKRLKWLFTGRVGAYIFKDGEVKVVTHKGKKHD